jgi:hypothetical protein
LKQRINVVGVQKLVGDQPRRLDHFIDKTQCFQYLLAQSDNHSTELFRTFEQTDVTVMQDGG